MTTLTVDPITEQVIDELLISIVREMRATMIRSAYSSTVYEMMDFSCALFDPAGRMVAQAEDLGSHVIPMPATVKMIMDQFGADLAPGDVVMLNDPYHSGTHLNDVSVVYPLFVGDELLIFPANRAHWDDVGGSTPGSMSGRARDVFQEGLRIPPIKVYERGRVNQAALDLIFLNMRVPDERRGDFRAMMATCRAAERRIGELVGKYGLDTVKAAIEMNMRRSEERMRRGIRTLPDGEYVYEDYLEFYGPDGLDPVLMRLALTVRDGSIHADFSGSSGQVPGPVNSTLAVTTGGVVIALKSILDPEGPINHGSFVPIAVNAPEGTIVNARPPAAVGAGNVEVSARVADVCLGALAQALPERVGAASQVTMNNTLLGGDGWVYYETVAGGQGGRPTRAGMSGVHTGMTNSKNTPVEALERAYPVRVRRTRLRRGSGGAGRNPGGEGIERDLEVLEDATLSLITERRDSRPWGLAGGEPGGRGENWLLPRGDVTRAERLLDKCTIRLRAGDVLRVFTPGGGGWGPPDTG